MQQIQIFHDTRQEDVNYWLQKQGDKITVHDMKLTSHVYQNEEAFFTVMVIYSPKPEQP